jgi:N-acetylneuraminic acid mutarotase
MNKITHRITVVLSLFLSLQACKQTPKMVNISDMPIAVSNNAVALVNSENGPELYCFNGLHAGKTWKDINNHGYVFSNGQWQQLQMPAGSAPVLASTAVSIGSNVYMIGGYTVDAEGNEKSVAEIFVLDSKNRQWSVATTMPVPVDDTVALVYAQRYIYLISGWHDVDNVSDVQVYDTHDDNWFNATAYPAPAVFGHAGGIIDNTMVICDGVKVVNTDKGKDFVASAQCMQGSIDPANPSLIKWQDLPHHSGTAYYRMAAAGQSSENRIVFVGGSDNPYNYDGIGYNEVPSEASATIYVYQLDSHSWRQYSDVVAANMDHRALLNHEDSFYIIGGMEAEQQVSNKIIVFKLPK